VSVLAPLALIFLAYFVLSFLAIGVAVTVEELLARRRRIAAEERAVFDAHVERELRNHLRVVGGSRISSGERWAA
jgi:hypothetical protein